jgi:hypothetical protein
VSNLDFQGSVNAFLGRHMPRRLWLRQVAGFQERLVRS